MFGTTARGTVSKRWKMRHHRSLGIAVLLALAVVLAVGLPAVYADGHGDKSKDVDQDQALTIDKTELKYPNLGSHLDQLVAGVEETTAEAAAGESPIRKGASVAVTVYLSGSVDDAVAFLEENGGDPRNMGEDYIEAYVPVSLLGPVSERPGVIRVREIVPPEPAQEHPIVSGHGPPVHGSVAWNEAGYTGSGVKVGIIDGHVVFNGFQGLMGAELPSTVQARCYTEVGRFTQNVADCEDDEEGGSHGTRVAEAVVDIAPEASLYIASPLSGGDFANAVDWMVGEGVSVIVQSQSWFFDGPGDGTSPFSDSPLRTVDRAVAGGVVWVNSGGNHARRTWFARSPFLDYDGDGFIEFAAGDEVNDLTLETGDLVVVQLRWEGSWGGARTDLDLGVQDNDARRLVAASIDPQSGGDGHVPFEGLVYSAPVDGSYGVVVRHVSGGVPGWIQLMVWRVPSIQHYTKTGGITNPSESANPGMLAVGAAHWDDVRAIEPYSSRGPTPDGRVKPDIVGAACGATALSPLDEYSRGFCGTSQAAPHVAGMAALVKHRFPSYTPGQVADYMKDNAQQRRNPDPNNTWGHGFAKLPAPGVVEPAAPTPSEAFTRNLGADFNTLAVAGNRAPSGIWSDGETMWVADYVDGKIYAYDMITKAWDPAKDFDTLQAAGNARPSGIWSDGTTMWVADYVDGKIYAYDMTTKARDPRNFSNLAVAGNRTPSGIWSDGETMWVADYVDDKIYAYHMATKARFPAKDFDTLKAAGNARPEGIWSDGTTMWVADGYSEKVNAYDMATKARVPWKEFNTLEEAGNDWPKGIWSDGETMWVSGWGESKVYAYHMPVVTVARSFSPDSVTPGGRVAVTVTTTNYGVSGAVTETLPAGFTYVSSSLADDQVAEVDARTIRFTLQGETSYTYTVTASQAVGAYSFSGTLRDFDRNDHAVGGDAVVTVSSPDTLIARYDTNNNGTIERGEVLKAITDYRFGEGDPPPTRAEVIELITLYLFA